MKFLNFTAMMACMASGGYITTVMTDCELHVTVSLKSTAGMAKKWCAHLLQHPSVTYASVAGCGFHVHHLTDSPFTQGSSDGDKSNGAHDGPVVAAGPLDGAQHPSVAGASYEAMRRKFFQLLYGHIVHKSDITAFEDTCRSMLGANSYVLFTIQKLVNKFARHLSGLIAVRPFPHIDLRDCIHDHGIVRVRL